MKKVLILTVLLAAAARGRALEPTDDPCLAVVRIKSHGASGTIIATSDGKSWILTCAHMFFDHGERPDQNLAGKKIVIDGPSQPYAPRKLAPVRVLAVDRGRDLSLLEIDNGPYTYAPIAARGFRPGRNLASAGYDEMRWPITHRPATVMAATADWTYTREKPWHGRSGGGLFDLDAKCLIGVVNGYETSGPERGIYVSHESVLAFIANCQNRLGAAGPAEPLKSYRHSNPLLFDVRRPNFLEPSCPPGVLCPR
jgi:hypothetical protein